MAAHDSPDHPDARLAQRLLAIEESHTFLARTLDDLSAEVLTVGNALRDLSRRVDRLGERLDGMDERPHRESDADGDAPGPGLEPFDDFSPPGSAPR